jgi:hypothetical protein
MGAVLSVAVVACSAAAFAEPVTKADLAGKTICWSNGYVVHYNKNGSQSWTGPYKGHGTWRLEGDQLIGSWANGEVISTLTKENGTLHGTATKSVGSNVAVGESSSGKYCK